MASKYKKDVDSSVILNAQEERARLDSRFDNERTEYEKFDYSLLVSTRLVSVWSRVIKTA